MNATSGVLPPGSPAAPDAPQPSWPDRLRNLGFVDKTTPALASTWRQCFIVLSIFAATSLLNLWLKRWMGYQTIALVYLLAIVLLALFVNRASIVFGTLLTALGWRFLFAPPLYSFSIEDTYDEMMFLTYFVVALTVGQLTARLRAQRETQLHARLLMESERLGRTLLNSVSHELRTPIAAITSAASTLQSAGQLTAEQRNLIVEVEAASARLNRVVQSLLSAARIQSGQLRPKLDWCDVADLIQVAQQSVKDLGAGYPIEVNVAPDASLMKADFVLMEQALANLVVNATTHTPRGTPIKIIARRDDDELIIEVADRGPGLPADELERIFEPFHRAPTAHPGGTGLGLAIVKGFVEAQGGRVRAANRPGGGAVFSIAIPITENPELPEEDL